MTCSCQLMILSSPCVLLCLTLWLFGKKLNLMHPEILIYISSLECWWWWCKKFTNFRENSMANGTRFCVKKCHQLIIFLWKFWNLSKLSSFSVKCHILRVLFLLILFLTADWARCRDGCEEDTEEEQQECDQEDQGVLLLQVGQPAGLAAIFNLGRVSSLSSKTRMRLFPRAGWKSDSSGQH